MLSIGEGETPGIGSVEFSRGWTLNELSELVGEGRNLALCTVHQMTMRTGEKLQNWVVDTWTRQNQKSS